jgi:hypothetical protein
MTVTEARVREIAGLLQPPVPENAIALLLLGLGDLNGVFSDEQVEAKVQDALEVVSSFSRSEEYWRDKGLRTQTAQ